MNIRIFLIAFLCIALAGCSALGTPVAQQNTAPTTAGQSAAQPNVTTQNQPAAPLATSTQASASQPAAQPTNTTAPAAAAQPTMPAAVPATGQTLLVPADALLDYNVVDPSGSPLGKVKDLVIQRGTSGAGQIPYVIVESGLREDWNIPVPWKSIQVRPDTMSVVVPTNATQFAAAPGFNKDVWPTSFAASANALQSFWANPGQAAGAANMLQPGAAQAADYIRAKDLLDLKIVSPQGVKLGKIDNFAIDWKNSAPGSASAATFQYVLLELDDNVNPTEPLVPIPWRLINMTPQQDTAVLNLTPQMLQTVPNFAKGSWPDLYSAPWSAQLQQFWANR